MEAVTCVESVAEHIILENAGVIILLFQVTVKLYHP